VKVILKQDVVNLGKAGDVVTVKPGYGRNFLIPREFAILADAKNVKQVEHQKKTIAAQQEKTRREAMTLVQKLESLSPTIRVEIGEQDKMYGSITSRDIEHALVEEGFKVDRKQILLDEPLKTLGQHAINIRLHHEVVGTVKIWVVAK